MEIRNLVRLAGAAAALGGAARVLSAFVPYVPSHPGLEALYAAIDVLLSFGLVGAYLTRAREIGVAGLCAFVLAASGLSFIGGPDADVFGFSTYQVGGAVVALAMAAFGAIVLVRRAAAPWAPACWIASLAAGLVASLGPAGDSRYAHWAFVAAGVLFGAGFVAIGREMLRQPGA